MFKGMKVDRKFAAAVLAALLAGCTTPDSARRVCQPMDGLFPPDVKTVGIVSLSSILERDVFDRGVRLLEEAGYRVKVMPNAYGPEVAPPETRARLFEQAWLDPEIDLLFFSRGGEGAIDTIGLIDWERLRARDMRVIGFSDVTIVLQTMLAKKAGHPYSGPMLTNIAEPRMTTRSLDWFRRVTAGENLPPAKLKGVKAAGGAVSGLPAGGLLERLHRMATKGILPDLSGRIVFIESTPNYVRRVDALLDDLLRIGSLDSAAAVVFCDFRTEGSQAETIAAFAKKAKCPVYSGFPYGHNTDSHLLDFRRPCTISLDGVLTWKNKE